MDWAGGIVLLGLAALIALGFRLSIVPPALATPGAVIIGWLTIREHVIPAWVGWLFLAQGLLNFLAGQFRFASVVELLPML